MLVHISCILLCVYMYSTVFNLYVCVLLCSANKGIGYVALNKKIKSVCLLVIASLLKFVCVSIYFYLNKPEP